MRKTFLLIILLCCGLVFTACEPDGLPNRFRLPMSEEEIGKIVFHKYPEEVTITDEAMIQQIVEQIGSLEFKKGQWNNSAMVWYYGLTWYDHSDNVIDGIIFNSDTGICYENYFCSVVEGSIDIEMLEKILEEANE